jgi:hypothetical protein
MSEGPDHCVQDTSNGKVQSNRQVLVSLFVLPRLNHGEMARIFAAKANDAGEGSNGFISSQIGFT